jgi:hypothetical protein
MNTRLSYFGWMIRSKDDKPSKEYDALVEIVAMVHARI